MPYSGNWANIPLGTMGLMSDLPSSEIPTTALIKSTNIDYGPGYVQKAPGAVPYNTTAFSAGVVGIQDYWLDVITQRLLAATSDGKIYKDYGDRTFRNSTPIMSGLGKLNGRCQFIIGGNESSGNPKKIFFFSDGISQVQVISGDNNTGLPIALPASDWANPTASTNQTSNFPKFGLLSRGRLWVFAKSVAYASSTTNHEDFQTSNAILVNSVGPGDGGDIIGAFVYKGLMLVFKQGDVVYQLIDTDASSSNWYFKKFAEGFSIANFHASTQVLDDLIAGNSTGTLTSYRATLNYGNFTQGDLFKQARVSQFYKQYATPPGILFQQSCFYPERGRAFFSARSGYKTFNDSLILFDVSDSQNPRFGLWTHWQADCIALRRDVNNVLRPIYGGTDGNVYLADRETRAVNGTAYTAEFQTPYLDMRHLNPTYALQNKAFEFLTVTFTPAGNHNLSVDVWIDEKFVETVNVAMTVDTNTLGTFKLGSSRLGGVGEQTIQVPIKGRGRRISLRCYNGNAYQNFKVSQLAIGFRVLGEDATRLY